MNNFSSGLISFIIPTYNRAKYICDAVESILNQTYKNYEIIVIDDGSTDNTRNILTKYREHILYIYQERRGVSTARNRGFRESKGEYIIFLDSDDLLCPQMSEHCINIFKEQRNCNAVFGIASWGNINDKSQNRYIHKYVDGPKENENIFKWIITGKVLTPGQYALKRICFEAAGGFNEKKICGEDWELLLKISKDYNFFYVPIEFVKIRSHNEKRNYDYKRNLLVQERLRTLDEVFGKEAENIKRLYIDKKVIADWYKCVGFTQLGIGNAKDAKHQMLLSLKTYPFQPRMYIWLLYQSLPAIVHKYWRGLKKELKFFKNDNLNKKIKVAIVSSGLEHIKRGVEVSARNLAYALKEEGLNVTLYKGSNEGSRSNNGRLERVIPCLKRNSSATRLIKRIRPASFWHIGLGSTYEIEQTSFSVFMLLEAIFRQYDIIYTKDPVVANVLNAANKFKLIRSRVIFANGTEAPLNFVKRFNYVQHLAPFYLQEARQQGIDNKQFAIPNFVDTEKFRPGENGNLRKKWGFKEDDFIIISVSAIKRHHKRVDYLIKEVSKIKNNNLNLIIVGSETNDTALLENLGKDTLKDKIKFLIDVPHEKIPEIYRCADMFVLCSLSEMFGTVFIEAMASGLPAIGHKHPVIEWVIGKGGECIDMTKEGELAKSIEKYIDESYREEKSRKAREQAVNNFSKEVVLEQVIDMFNCVLNGK